MNKKLHPLDHIIFLRMTKAEHKMLKRAFNMSSSGDANLQAFIRRLLRETLP
jgi:hypothetical protein